MMAKGSAGGVDGDPHRLKAELDALRDEAQGWFDEATASDGEGLSRLHRALAGSSLLDASNPDLLDLGLVRTVARVPTDWGDAVLFAGVAVAALGMAADELEDEAFAVRYIGAARAALRLAENLDAPRLQTAPAAAAKRERHERELREFAGAWLSLPAGDKFEAKKSVLSERFSKSEATIERWLTEARKSGLLD